MKPLSPFYFIKENKARCFLLIFMIFLSYSAYLGGVYITNLMDNWELMLEYSEELVSVYPSSDDKDSSDFYAFEEAIKKEEKVDVLQLASYNTFNWNSIMGFESGSYSFTFLSVEDFKTFCARMDITCDFENVKNGSLIMSERFAKNRALQLGDTVDKDYSQNVYSTFTVDAFTEEDGYTLYFINEDDVPSNNIIVLGNEIDSAEAYRLSYRLQEQYKVQITDGFRAEVEGQFETFHLIYMFILILVSLVLAVTIHAAFVGMYQRRNIEFAVYRAIGMSKKRINCKIIGELLCMDLIALVVGGVIFFISLYLFNNLVLYPAGKYLEYFHPIALGGLVLCNIMVILPLIITRCRQMMKVDICEY